MSEICEVVVTAPGPGWTVEFSKKLVESRLAASVHNFAPIRTIYWWRGAVRDELEVRIAVHTRTSLVEAIKREVRSSHPFITPCVIATPIEDADQDYKQWVIEQTSKQDNG